MSRFNQLFDNNPNKEAIECALIGSRQHIEMMILMLHSQNIVEGGEWCRLQEIRKNSSPSSAAI